MLSHGFPDVFAGRAQHGNGVSLVATRWGEYSMPVAALILLHGAGEHAGRYETFASALACQRIATFSYDQRGHGKSGGLRCYAEHPDEWLHDLQEYYDLVAAQLPPAVPVFVMGHSMGSAVSCLWLLRNQERLARAVRGVIFSGPAFAPGDDVSGTTIAVGTLVSKIAPQMGIVAFPPSKGSDRPSDCARACLAHGRRGSVDKLDCGGAASLCGT